MTEEEVLQEILGALKGNGMQQAANGVYELCAYVDSMTKKVEYLSRDVELNRMKEKQMEEPKVDYGKDILPIAVVAEPSVYQYGAEAFEAAYPKMKQDKVMDVKTPTVLKTEKVR